MPVDIALLVRKGGSAEKLKAKFTSRWTKEGKGKDLIEMTSTRIDDGINQNFKDAKLLWAIDRAYDVPQRQITRTIVEGLVSRKASTAQVQSAMDEFNLNNMVTQARDVNGVPQVGPDSKPVMALNVPLFTNIFVPIVMAYVKAREARLTNERNLDPLYPYNPIRTTMKEKLKCELITHRVNRQAAQMGYRADEQQSIHQMLLYGECLNFPMEEWYAETQLFGDSDTKRIVKEGIRYEIPHPARTFKDLAHRVSTFNSDTGCQWAGHWSIKRFGEFMGTKGFWNTEAIAKQFGQFKSIGNPTYKLYEELFPCRHIFPGNTSSGSGAGDKDRLDRAADQYYTTNDRDKAVTMATIFQKIIPSEWDLYDYDYPVWHRMVFAGQESVVYCSPVGYSPILAYLYDHDANRAFNTSLGLELIPWQDHVGNYLTQHLLTVKKNLMRAVFWDPGALKQEDVDQIANMGDKLYTETKFIPMSKREIGFQQLVKSDAFSPVNFPQGNSVETATSISLLLNVMERVIGFSAQETGSAASHEQSAAESHIIADSTSNRLQFTGIGVDAGRYARKGQLYEAGLNYWSDEIFGEVANLDETKEAALTEMGFKIEEKGESHAGVRGSKAKLSIDGFVSASDVPAWIADPKIAATIIQTYMAMFSSPEVVQAIGVEQLVETFNNIAYYAGVPKDVRLKVVAKSPAQQAAQAQEQLKQMQQMMVQVAQEVVGQEMEKLGETLKSKVIDPMEQGQQQLGQEVQKLEEQAQQGQQFQQQVGEAIKVLGTQLKSGEERDAAQDAAIEKIIGVFHMAEQATAEQAPQA